MSGEGIAIITVGVLTLVGTCISNWVSWLIKKHATEINDSVNHRHERADGKRLMDLVVENHADIKVVSSKVERLDGKLEDHITRCSASSCQYRQPE